MKAHCFAMALAAGLVMSPPVEAQGLLGGAQAGSEAGGDIGGPIGFVIGGAVGAATGSIKGLLGVDVPALPQSYSAARRPTTYPYDKWVPVGRHGDGTERILVVDPRSRRIVEVID